MIRNRRSQPRDVTRQTQPTPTLLVAIGLLVSLGGAASACTKREKPDGEHDAAAPPPATSVSAKVADVQPPARRDASAPRAAALTSEQRRELVRALDAGRKKSQAKDYKGAIADFDRALAISPNDGRVLSELGYAALLDGDLARADVAHKHALATVHDPVQRAQVLYNAGRVAEERKDVDTARAHYAASLALRENTTVRKRLEGVGGAAPAALPCSAGGATVEQLCACLAKEHDALGFVLDTGEVPACAATAASLQLGTPLLSVVRVGGDDARQRMYLLAARDHGKLRPVAELGSDFEPGAFGVHNEASVERGEVRTIGGRSVVVVTSEQNNVDMNLAGLEACTSVERRETICAMSDEASKRPTTRCVSVAVSSEDGCGPGVEPDGLGPEDLAMLDERKASWGKTTKKRTWSIEDNGSLLVRDDAGKTVKYTLF